VRTLKLFQVVSVLNSFAVLKNMLMRLKQFQCFISVLFHRMQRGLQYKKHSFKKILITAYSYNYTNTIVTFRETLEYRVLWSKVKQLHSHDSRTQFCIGIICLYNMLSVKKILLLYFHFDAISDVITKRKQKFLNNYQSSENLLCSVVCSTWWQLFI